MEATVQCRQCGITLTVDPFDADARHRVYADHARWHKNRARLELLDAQAGLMFHHHPDLTSLDWALEQWYG